MRLHQRAPLDDSLWQFEASASHRALADLNQDDRSADCEACNLLLLSEWRLMSSQGSVQHEKRLCVLFNIVNVYKTPSLPMHVCKWWCYLNVVSLMRFQLKPTLPYWIFLFLLFIIRIYTLLYIF